MRKKQNAVTDANGNRVVVSLDWRGNTRETTLPAGQDFGVSTRVNAYDASGFLISATDAQGFTRHYIRNPDGSVATDTNPEGGNTPELKDIQRVSFGADTDVGGYMQLATVQALMANLAKTAFNDIGAGDEPDVDID